MQQIHESSRFESAWPPSRAGRACITDPGPAGRDHSCRKLLPLSSCRHKYHHSRLRSNACYE